MPGPASGIVSLAVFGNRGPGEHTLDSAPHARCCLGRLVPDRLQGLPPQASVDRRDRQVIDDSRRSRKDMFTAFRLIKRGGPLRGVLVVLPSASICRHIGVSAVLKRHRLGGFDLFLSPYGVTSLAGVDPLRE